MPALRMLACTALGLGLNVNVATGFYELLSPMNYWNDTYWRHSHGHDALERDAFDLSADAYLDKALCVDEPSVVSAVQFYASGPGTCFQPLVFEYIDPYFVTVTADSPISATYAGAQLMDLPKTIHMQPRSCLGWLFPADAPCRVSFSDNEPSSEVFQVRGLNGTYPTDVDPKDMSRLQRKYSFMFSVVDMSPPRVVEFSYYMSLPVWNQFEHALHEAGDFAHPTVTTSALALHEQLAAPAGMISAFISLNTRAWIGWLEHPLGWGELNEFFLGRMHALVVLCIAVVVAKCSARSPTDHEVEVKEMMRFVNVFWMTAFALPEHSSWGIGYYDAAAVVALTSLPQHSCPRGRLADYLITAGRSGEGGDANIASRIPQPLDHSSWWPTHRGCTLRVLGMSPPPRLQHSSLHVVVVEAHHADYQEVRALVERVSLDIWAVAPTFVSYLLIHQPSFLAHYEHQQLHGENHSQFWGKQGPPETRGTGQDLISLTEGLELVKGWLQKDDFLRHADVVVDCNPLWVCVVLRHLAAYLPIMVRVNMALLQHYHAWEDLPMFWSWFSEFVASPRTAMATKNRLVAEQFFHQTGARPEYVPYIALHLQDIVYSPVTDEVLVYKNTHAGFEQFRALLAHMAIASQARLAFHQDILSSSGLLSYSDMAGYFAVVLVPHVPNSCSFADVYAMQTPIFLPAEPYIYTWMWAFSNVYAGPIKGPGFNWRQSVAPPELRASPPGWWVTEEHGDEPHRYTPFAHLDAAFTPDHFFDKAYWFQYSDYAMLPGLRRFRTIPDLLDQLSTLSSEEAMVISRRMRRAHERRVHESTRWVSCTLAKLVGANL